MAHENSRVLVATNTRSPPWVMSTVRSSIVIIQLVDQQKLPCIHLDAILYKETIYILFLVFKKMHDQRYSLAKIKNIYIGVIIPAVSQYRKNEINRKLLGYLVKWGIRVHSFIEALNKTYKLCDIKYSLVS